MKNKHPIMISVRPPETPPETGGVAKIEDARPAAALVGPPDSLVPPSRSPDTESPDAFEERFFVYS